jgi:hypothetical protein
MGEHVADVDSASVDMHGSDASVFVPANVEHDEVSDFVRRRKSRSQGLEARKVVLLHDFEPSGKGIFAVGVLFPKLV